MKTEGGRIWYQSNPKEKVSFRQVPLAILNGLRHEQRRIKLLQRFQNLQHHTNRGWDSKKCKNVITLD
jgi:hypothetical protein